MGSLNSLADRVGCVKTLVFGVFILPLSVIAQPLTEESPWVKSSVSEQTVPEGVSAPILAHLKKARPELEFTDLKRSPIEGIYEIKINGHNAFVSQTGEYLIAGEMYEVRPSGLVKTFCIDLSPWTLWFHKCISISKGVDLVLSKSR